MSPPKTTTYARQGGCCVESDFGRARCDAHHPTLAAIFAGFIASLILMAAFGGIAMYAVNGAHARVHDRLAPIDRRHSRMLQLMSDAQSSLRGFEVTGIVEILEPYTNNQAAYRDTVEDVLDRVGFRRHGRARGGRGHHVHVQRQ